MRVNPNWDEVETEVEEIELFSQEVKNEEEVPGQAPWKRTYQVDAKVEHKFELNHPQNIAGCGLDVIRGCKFNVDKIKPLVIEVENGPDEVTGSEFHHQLESQFTFVDETKSSRSSSQTCMIRLPPRIPPRCDFKVRVIQIKATFKASFKADFKLGFDANYDLGSDSWYVWLTLLIWQFNLIFISGWKVENMREWT